MGQNVSHRHVGGVISTPIITGSGDQGFVNVVPPGCFRIPVKAQAWVRVVEGKATIDDQLVPLGKSVHVTNQFFTVHAQDGDAVVICLFGRYEED